MYEAEYGSKPRGEGFWIFKISQEIAGQCIVEEVVFRGYYSECIAQAKNNYPNAYCIRVMV